MSLCWDVVREIEPSALVVQITMDKVKIIKEGPQITPSRQKSYGCVRRKDLKFQVGDWTFLEIITLEKYYRFWKQGKLSQIKGMWRIEIPVMGVRGYPNWVESSSELFRVQDVLHVSILSKYVVSSSHILEIQRDTLRE
jgi:hypothetical protein